MPRMRKIVPPVITLVGVVWQAANFLVTLGTMPGDIAQLWEEYMSNVGWMPIALMLSGVAGTVYVFSPHLWRRISSMTKPSDAGRIENNYGFATANGPLIVNASAPGRTVDQTTEAYLLSRLEKSAPVDVEHVQGEEPARFAEAIAIFLEVNGYRVAGRGMSYSNFSGLFAGCPHYPGQSERNVVRVGYRDR